MKIPYISVSRTGVWDTCPQQYKYKYHLELASLEPEPPYFLYGKVVHKICEEYIHQEGQINIQDIKNAVLNDDLLLEDGQPNNGWGTLPWRYKERLPGNLAAFMKLNEKIGSDGQTEYKFNYDLDPPNGKHVHGFIDRIVKRKDHYFIIDYKTTVQGSAWRKNRNNITSDLQLQCYAYVLMKELNVAPENIMTSLYYFEGSELLAARFTEETLNNLSKKLLAIYNQVDKTHPDSVRGVIGDHCKRCDYRKICPYYSL